MTGIYNLPVPSTYPPYNGISWCLEPVTNYVEIYQQECEKTESNSADNAIRASSCVRKMHAISGLVTESAEMMDNLKKHIYYGKEIDILNLKEEIGDVLWYIALLCNDLNVNMIDMMKANIQKLKTRYPNKFSNDSALNRNLDNENEVLKDLLNENTGSK